MHLLIRDISTFLQQNYQKHAQNAFASFKSDIATGRGGMIDSRGCYRTTGTCLISSKTFLRPGSFIIHFCNIGDIIANLLLLNSACLLPPQIFLFLEPSLHS